MIEGYRSPLLVIALLLVSLGVAQLRASFVPPLDLNTLTSKADVIVLGRILEVETEGPATLRPKFVSVPIQGHEFLGHLAVERTLKGKVTAGVISFRFALPDAPVGYVGIGRGEFGVFFLRAVAGGLGIMDPYHPFVVAAPGLGMVSGSLEDQVLAQVAHVLTYPASTRGMRVEAVLVLQAVNTPRATKYLNEAAESADVRVRVLALSTLLNRGDNSVLPAVKSIAFSSAAADDNLMMSVGGALRDIHDPRAIPALRTLLQSPSVWVRRGAAAALRNTHSPGAIRPLCRALYDTDREVRYYAVVGLGEITGQNRWTPSITTFNQSEQKFLKHWRGWAKTNGYR